MVRQVYWSGCMKRNWHRLNHVRPQIFGLDMTNSCKYRSFSDMYDSTEEELIEAKFMMMLQEPEFKDKGGKHVGFESDRFCCKVTSELSQPDMVLLDEKSGGNIYMTYDGYIGGEKVICDKVCIAKIKSTIKSKHFTFIGITNLLGEPIY